MTTDLESRVLEWIAPYWNADHLVRTRDWVVELDPEAGEALQLAALTHDIERHFPGGPRFDPATMEPGDRGYREAHSRRSAGIVTQWLREQSVGEELVSAVEALIVAHEVGGSYEEDVLQAADSLAFLEVNSGVVACWVSEGRCSPERGKAQHRWMFERIGLERARRLARPYYEEAVAAVAPA